MYYFNIKISVDKAPKKNKNPVTLEVLRKIKIFLIPKNIRYVKNEMHSNRIVLTIPAGLRALMLFLAAK